MDEYIKKISEKTKTFSHEVEISPEEVKELIRVKKASFHGSVDDDVAISMVCNDLGFNSSEIEETEISNKENKFNLAVQSPKTLPLMEPTHYPSEEEILFLVNRRKFVKNTLIDKAEDLIKISGTLFLKKSGTQKYINAFGISIEILDSKVYNNVDDVIAEYRIKATAPNGQFVIADGTKSKSEYWSERSQTHGSYSLHNLKATARTRAIHIAVSDLVGYGELSLESLPSRYTDGLPEEEFEPQR